MICQDFRIVNLNEFSDKKSASFDIKNNEKLLFIGCKDFNLTINVLENVSALISMLFLNDDSSFKLTINLAKGTQIEAFCADFTFETFKNNVLINLLGEGAICNWHLASLSQKADNKSHSISATHYAAKTTARIDNYGVAKDDSHLTFLGVSHIKDGSAKSKTSQNAKIMVFDEESIGTAKPILKIDDNDVVANHAAVVGKINEEHLFYLTSRGLCEDSAKALITLGYLKPILAGFDDNHQKQIMDLIEGRMNNV